MPFIQRILRYYDCFFNSLDHSIALVFFGISGKNTDRNQDSSSFEAVATPPVRQIGVSRYSGNVAPCRPRVSTPQITSLIFASPAGKGGGAGFLPGQPSHDITKTTDQ
jgi:hypothetical protein